MIAAGADIIFGQGDGASFGMMQAVETSKATDGGKVWFIDVIGDKTPIDKGNLFSSVVWDIEPVYTAMIEDSEGRQVRRPTSYSISLADNSVHLLKTKHIPDDVWAELQAIREDIIDGKIKVEPVFDAAVRACARHRRGRRENSRLEASIGLGPRGGESAS